MKYFGAGLGEMHKELGTMIRKADRLEDARRLFSELHGALHLSEVSGGEENELDRLTGDLEDPEYAVMVTSKDETIAWALWHIARLEDLTMNLLVSGGEQVWNREWARRLGTAVADHGAQQGAAPRRTAAIQERGRQKDETDRGRTDGR